MKKKLSKKEGHMVSCHKKFISSFIWIYQILWIVNGVSYEHIPSTESNTVMHFPPFLEVKTKRTQQLSFIFIMKTGKATTFGKSLAEVIYPVKLSQAGCHFLSLSMPFFVVLMLTAVHHRVGIPWCTCCCEAVDKL